MNNLPALDALMVAFFASNPGKSIRDWYQSLTPEQVGDEDALRVATKGAHARATRLVREGKLARLLGIDASGQEVMLYSLPNAEGAEPGTGVAYQPRGWKARFEAEKAKWDAAREELEDGMFLWKLEAEKRTAEVEALKAKLAAAEASQATDRKEIESLMAILDVATATTAAKPEVEAKEVG